MKRIATIAFDADDTLWHTESHFQATQARLSKILNTYAPHEQVQARLHEVEERNIKLFGYGVKGFTLSMIEAAIDISGQRISAADIHEIAMMGKAMLDRPLELLPDVEAVLTELGRQYRLIMITKGDPMDQQNKIVQSGLAHHFEEIEIVAVKDVDSYRTVFSRLTLAPADTVMIGNSIPSDVEPILALGGFGIYIPYHVTASFERHRGEPDHPSYRRIDRIAELPVLIGDLV
jgi:putative hydrolase of the HAD superfamily